MRLFLLISLLLVPLSIPLHAAPPPGNSKPDFRAIENSIPPPRDTAPPGPMLLDVDATDVERGIIRVRQTIPIAGGGPKYLLYPQWLPGNHAPRGEIEKLTGLKITADGKPVEWRRDSLDVYAFRVDPPKGAKSLVAEFEFASATAANQGRVVVAPKIINLRWQQVSLYPAGYFTRNLPVIASATFPIGWKAASALGRAEVSDNRVTYETTDYDTLIDSPVLAGAYFKSWPLSDKVTLNVVADAPEYLVASEAQIENHKHLVHEARALFGTEHYDHYDFLLALSDELGGIGVEHHRSSENGVTPEYFTDWDKGPGRRNLLPHEMSHSWNGKYRRPAGLTTPDFRTPMQGELLWVYEGQTQFWGYVLGARSGLFSTEQTLDYYADMAAVHIMRSGRNWRPLVDTTNDPVIAARRPKGWLSWQRSEDYYNEGMLVWLEANAIIDRESGGTKSLQDFAQSFFGGRDGDWGVVTYALDDVIAALDKVQPYDWRSFIDAHVYRVAPAPPLDWIAQAGYELTYSDTPNSATKGRETRGKMTDFSFGLGLSVSEKGEIEDVIWGGPAFAAGLTNGLTIANVNGVEYSADVLKQAVRDNKGKNGAIVLLVKQDKRFRTVSISYSGGLRYPALIKTGEGETSLDRLLASQAP